MRATAWFPCYLRATFAVAALSACVAASETPAERVEVTVAGRAFRLPPGFTIERIAAPPLVDRPIVAAWDEQGRLYVADSSGTNDSVQKQLAEKPHRVVRLEDVDGDGRFDRSIVFADHVMFPEGALWRDGSLYVAAPPSIWKFTDTDDDGVADERVEWFQGKTLTGCANDLHGPYAGPDGWIYWCKGAFAEQTYERPGKPPFVTRASHIFRARPDGTGIEHVLTGGMDNPVDVVFTPGGERILSNTFIVHPGNGQRDGLLHAVYGGVYGKVHGVLDGHIRTSPDVMPVLDHLGPAAACGMTTFESNTFGSEYRDNLFVCNFNLQKLTRHVLTPSGGTFATKDEDFLVTTDRDFHPTDVLDDADGSLVVIDTGGWYKLCCPTSQLPKPDVLGAIYRVRKLGAPAVVDPRGLKIAWESLDPKDLSTLLDDPRPVVRQRAIAALGQRRIAAVPALAETIKAGKTPESRRNAVWAATRIDHTAARLAIRQALGDPDESVRQVAAHSVSVRRDPDALPALVGMLLNTSAQNRRVAAEAIGRLGDPSAIPTLLSALGEPVDRVLEHSLIYALIEIGHPREIAIHLQSKNPRARRAAAIALDQLNDSSRLKVVPALLTSADPDDRAIGTWISGRHPEGMRLYADIYRDRLKEAAQLPNADRAALGAQLAKFAAQPNVREMLGTALLDRQSSMESLRVVVRALANSAVKEVPEHWSSGLAALLSAPDRADLRADAVAAIRALPWKPGQGVEVAKVLEKLGADARAEPSLRLAALAAVPGGLNHLNAELFTFLIDHLTMETPVADRALAAESLSRATLTPEQLHALTIAVKSAGPLEVDRLLAAFEKSKDDAVGLELVEAVAQASALGSLRVDMLKPRFDKFGPPVRAKAEAIYAKLNVNAAEQKAKLESLLPTLNGGDVRRGQAVFNGTKAACLSCHAVGYVGGKVGPDLTKIGSIRTERDLLESILYPSLSFVRSYEPMTVATKDGKVVNGLLKKDAADEIILTVNAHEEARLPRAAIEEMRPGAVSVMPAGLDQQLSRQDLADLLAFLKSRK